MFAEYGGRIPTADDIIHNAVIQRYLRSGKPHLILPKLAAMFPDNYASQLAEEVKRDSKVRRVVHLMKAGQIKGEYYDPVERLIAENYFDSSKLPKPLCRLSRDDAVEQLKKHFQKRITVDEFRRHVQSLFLREYQLTARIFTRDYTHNSCVNIGNRVEQTIDRASDDLLVKRELAKKIQALPSHRHLWMRQGKLPYLKIGKTVLFRW